MPYLLLVFLHTRIMFFKKSENKYFNFKGKLCIQFSMLFLSSSTEWEPTCKVIFLMGKNKSWYEVYLCLLATY